MSLDLKSIITVRDRLSDKLSKLCAEHSRLSAQSLTSWRRQAKLHRLSQEIDKVSKAIERLEAVAEKSR